MSCKNCGKCKLSKEEEKELKEALFSQEIDPIVNVKVACQMALGKKYGFTSGLDEINILITNWENYHLIEINGKVYRIRDGKVEKVKVVASYGYEV